METIFELQTVTGFAFDPDWGAYTNGYVMPSEYVLESGNDYSVSFDGEIFFCTAFSFLLQGVTIVAIGNGAYVGMSGNDEPFLLTYAKINNTSQMFTNREGESHEIGIFQGERGILLKDFAGSEIEYTDVRGVNLLKDDGSEQIFTPGMPQTKTVSLDFSSGDMTVTPDSGFVLTGVEIQKPSTLVPEFIKKDEVIAGVKGTFEGSGGGNLIPCVFSYYTSKHEQDYSSTNKTVTLKFDITIPQKNEIYSFAAGGITQTSTTNVLCSVPQKLEKVQYTTSADGNNMIVSWTYTTSISSRKYYTAVASVNLIFCMDGITIEEGDIGKIFRADNTVENLPSSDFVKPNFVKAVLSNSQIKSIPPYFFNDMSELTLVDLPNTLEIIDNQVFFNCTKLSYIEFPNSVVTIGTRAFYSCKGLQHVNLGNGVKTIGDYAFQYCGGLTSITIPNSVTTIGAGAFYGCSSLSECHVKATTPPTLSPTNVFNSVSADFVIYVPVGTLETYQAATNWSTYASKMQEETE